MKISLTTILLLVCIFGIAQPATLKLKSGESKAIQIKASSNSQLFVDGGTINFTSIDSIAFESPRPIDKPLYDKLVAAGISVNVGGEQMQRVSPIVVPVGTITQTEIDSFEKFNKQRTAGKIIQLLGAAALSTSVFLMAKYRNDDIDQTKKPDPNYEVKKAPIGLVIGGGAALIIGIGMDIEAGKHLKKR